MKNFLVLDAPPEKESLYQWDLNQRFVVVSPNVLQVQYYFSEKIGLLSCAIYEEDGITYVNIPNIILQQSGSFRVYIYGKDHTIVHFQVPIEKRPKPNDYIYEETEVVSLTELVDEIIKKEKLVSKDYVDSITTFNIDDGDGDGSIVQVGNTASGNRSVALGNSTIASGDYSLAEGGGADDGRQTIASGTRSHAEGKATIASGEDSHAEGGYTTADGKRSHAEGNETSALGVGSHSEGTWTTAYGADGSHAEGYKTAALGQHSHVEGMGGSGDLTDTTNVNVYLAGLVTDRTKSLDEIAQLHNGTRNTGEPLDGKYFSLAYQLASHAEGRSTVAYGPNSHSEGQITFAGGKNAHTEGYATVGYGENQHVQGRCNIIDDEGKYAHIVGNGQYKNKTFNRSNAHTLDWNGNAWFAGNVTVGKQNDKLVTQKEMKTEIANLVNSAPETLDTLGELATELKENQDIVQTLNQAITDKAGKEEVEQLVEGLNISSGSGQNSVQQSIATAEDRKGASGIGAFATGYATEASGNYSHAEGKYTRAQGERSHTEGANTLTRTGAFAAHAEGDYTIASKRCQHVQGRFNTEDTGVGNEYGNYAHIVGNGASSNNRSNAHTLDWDGNAWFQGGVYVQETEAALSEENMVRYANAKKLATETYVDEKIDALKITTDNNGISANTDVTISGDTKIIRRYSEATFYDSTTLKVGSQITKLDFTNMINSKNMFWNYISESFRIEFSDGSALYYLEGAQEFGYYIPLGSFFRCYPSMDGFWGQTIFMLNVPITVTSISQNGTYGWDILLDRKYFELAYAPGGDIHAEGFIYSNNEKLTTELYVNEKVSAATKETKEYINTKTEAFKIVTDENGINLNDKTNIKGDLNVVSKTSELTYDTTTFKVGVQVTKIDFSIFDGDEEWYYHSAKDFSVDFTDGSILSCVWNHCKYVTSAGEVLFECDTYNIRPESYILDLSDNPVTVASFTNIDQDMSRRETYDDVFTTNIGPLLNNIIFSKGEYSNGDIYADGSIYSNNEKLATESYIDEKVKNLPTSEEVVKHHNATAGRYAYIGESGTDRTMYIHEQLNKERLGYAHLPCRKYGGQVEVANAVNDCDAVNMQVLQHYLDQIATALGIELIAHPQETTIPTRNN